MPDAHASLPPLLNPAVFSVELYINKKHTGINRKLIEINLTQTNPLLYSPLQTDNKGSIMNITRTKSTTNTTPTTTHTPDLSKEHSDLIQKIKLINAPWRLKNNHEVASTLKKMDPIDLQILLHELFRQIAREGHKDPATIIDRLADFLPIEKLLDKNKHETVDSNLKEAKKLFDQADYYFKTKSQNTPKTIRKEVSKILNGIVSLIGSLIKLFDITELFDPEEMPFQTATQPVGKSKTKSKNSHSSLHCSSNTPEPPSPAKSSRPLSCASEASASYGNTSNQCQKCS